MDTPDDLGFDFKPELPVPISLVGGRYLLFDVKMATYLRREHHICGTTIGTLPLSPSQNLFLGIPVEIMPEEAQLLVEKGVGFVVDDARAHDQAMAAAADDSQTRRAAAYLERLDRQSRQVEMVRTREKEQSRKRALDKRSKAATSSSEVPASSQEPTDLLDLDDGDEDATPDSQTLGEIVPSRSDSQVLPDTTPPSTHYGVTPATSHLLLPTPPATPQPAINDLPPSYPLYRHLHEQGYFMTPGLRFGCQYTVYPGDPLRFHSHFLAIGTQWDQEIDLMDIVGGGRLGTGVKKGFLLGGASPTGDVRTFSVEWAVM